MVAALGGSEERVDLDMVTRLRAEEFQRSEVRRLLHELTDVLGPRLTGSPGGLAASEWTRQELARFGLVNAHLEPFPFGRGWSYSQASLRMLTPREVPLLTVPEAWTPGTSGVLRGALVKVRVETEKDFDTYKGKLAGKVVLLEEVRDPRLPERTVEGPEVKRYTEETLHDLGRYEAPTLRLDFRARGQRRVRFRKALGAFLAAEKALATISASSYDQGIFGVQARGNWEKDGGSDGIPGVVVTTDTYGMLSRLVADGKNVEIEVEVAARFHAEGDHSNNTIAEIPGTDKKGEIVMAGAHLDSWHSGTGATDNASGCVVVLEAARLLKALGVKPKRTIRIALWTGEEQGLLGSYYYVKDHFASRPETTDPAQKAFPEPNRDDTWPLQLKPEHAKLAAYFNIDNGSGKIRGVYAQGNAAVRPIFEAWLEPFHDLGATTVTLRDTRGTDHLSYDRVGLPGFQFIQDELDYNSRTHHTNLDDYEHARPEDLEQAAIILASFLYDAAMRPEPLPRKPLPTAPPVEEKKKDGVEEGGRERARESGR
ncbi:MAG TPA: M20/M25/M40 family metallo-hydrolase [Fimbriimonadaceae bacterium]|nr:M20/M25/M40 family metallo-hydrolase [Fimbriimonadaceae bacterium]